MEDVILLQTECNCGNVFDSTLPAGFTANYSFIVVCPMCGSVLEVFNIDDYKNTDTTK